MPFVCRLCGDTFYGVPERANSEMCLLCERGDGEDPILPGTINFANGCTMVVNANPSGDPFRSVADIGVKHDSGKPQFRLVLPEFLLQMVNVLTLGALKYPRFDNWKHVAPERYEDALERHWNAWRRGEKDDPESKMSHLAHVAVNAMFLWFFDTKKRLLSPI